MVKKELEASINQLNQEIEELKRDLNICKARLQESNNRFWNLCLEKDYPKGRLLIERAYNSAGKEESSYCLNFYFYQRGLEFKTFLFRFPQEKLEEIEKEKEKILYKELDNGRIIIFFIQETLFYINPLERSRVFYTERINLNEFKPFFEKEKQYEI